MKDQIVKAIKKVLEGTNIKITDAEIEKKIEIPPSPNLGDYSFPCFFLAGILKQDPKEIAIQLREKIGNPDDFGFQDIQTQGAYINFFFDRKILAVEVIKKVLEQKEKYGSVNIGHGKKALIEHTSINPNASPHVGRARNAILGDSIVKIFNFLGFKTEVHYYVNDVSKQIAMLVVANADKLKFDGMLKAYHGIAKKVEKSKELEQDVFAWLRRFEGNDKEAVKRFKKITETCVKGQKEILSKLGIEYHFFDYESSYLEKSKDILEKLKKTGKLHKDKEGRLYLDQRNTYLKKMMKSAVFVMTRSDGTGLYPLRDFVYTIEKMKKAEKNIIVLGEDQKLYFLQLKEALKILNYNAPEVVHYSFILLNSEGKSRKMSTRKGDVVLLEDFLDEVTKKAKKEIKKRKTKGDPETIAVASVKYKILKNLPNKIINFNLDEAMQFEGDTGPYLLYSYARAKSILRKAKKNLNLGNINISELDQKETNLMLNISKFSEVVLKAYESLDPSLIASYSYELAQCFNEFYHSCQVVGSHEENFRVALVSAFSHVLKNSLALLGIKTLERM